MSYYAEFDYVMENFGLCDTVISKQKLSDEVLKNGKVGHMKKASLDYIEEKNIHFCFQRSPYVKKNYRFVQFQVGQLSLRAEMFHYDKKMITFLRNKLGNGFRYFDLERYLDFYFQSEIEKQSLDERKSFFDEMEKYYFSMNNDDITVDQRNKFKAYLQ